MCVRARLEDCGTGAAVMEAAARAWHHSLYCGPGQDQDCLARTDWVCPGSCGLLYQQPPGKKKKRNLLQVAKRKLSRKEKGTESNSEIVFC